MLAKKTSKNQLTLPKDIVKEFPGIDYFDVGIKDSKIVLSPVKIMPASASLSAIRDKIEQLGLTYEDVTNAVKWARRNKAK